MPEDAEEDRRSGISEDIRDADADNRAVFFRHNVLQRDEPVYPSGEGESEYTMDDILHDTQYREMHNAPDGEIWMMGELYRGYPPWLRET